MATKIGKVSTMIAKNLIICLIIQVLKSAYSQGLIDQQSRAMPIQMDMSADEDITICTGLKRFIACRDGANLAVTNAFWGRTSDKVCPSDDGDPVTDCDGSEDTLPLVRRYCEAKNGCHLEAKHNLLQKNGTHHCPGVNKYLIVNYTCIPESKGVTLCDSAETTLNCQAGWTMELADVFWGRRASTKYCGTDEGMECDSSEYASKILRGNCNGKRRCTIKADSSTLDNNRSPCAGMLKYLMVNYICKPPSPSKANDDSDDDDNKILQDTSSKELMGLLEKHLNEIKTPESKEAKTAGVDEKKTETKQYGPQPKVGSKSNARTKARATLGRTNQNFVANEEDEITNTLLNAPAFTRSIGKKPEVPAPALKPTKKDETPYIPAESPVASIKEAKTKEQPSLGKSSNTAKDNVPKANEDEYELTEPNTVRSILARAKEVLKTLDSDTSSDDQLNKREGIARKDSTDDKFANETAKAVKQVAKLAQSLVNNAATKALKNGKQKKSVQSKIQQASVGAIQKPKPGSKKTGYRATGTGSAGIGNTP